MNSTPNPDSTDDFRNRNPSVNPEDAAADPGGAA